MNRSGFLAQLTVSLDMAIEDENGGGTLREAESPWDEKVGELETIRASRSKSARLELTRRRGMRRDGAHRIHESPIPIPPIAMYSVWGIQAAQRKTMRAENVIWS